jgi:hypothetical protein
VISEQMDCALKWTDFAFCLVPFAFGRAFLSSLLDGVFSTRLPGHSRILKGRFDVVRRRAGRRLVRGRVVHIRRLVHRRRGIVRLGWFVEGRYLNLSYLNEKTFAHAGHG